MLQETDYVDSVKKYNDAIDTIAKEVEPFATINKNKRTFTFRDKETVKKFYMDVISEAFLNHDENIRKGFPYPFFKLLQDIAGYCDFVYLHDGSYCVRMMSLISDYVFENSVPKVLYIGSIIDVHR